VEPPDGGEACTFGGEGGTSGTWVGAVGFDANGVAGVGDKGDSAFFGGAERGASLLAPPGKTGGIGFLMLSFVPLLGGGVVAEAAKHR
jgi:hypothetical protein